MNLYKVSSSLLSAGEEGVYDNPAMKRRPQAAVKAGSSNGPEEDIYGITGEGQGAEGIYDNPKEVGKGGKMDFSDTGIYDNPLAATGQGLYIRTHVNVHAWSDWRWLLM